MNLKNSMKYFSICVSLIFLTLSAQASDNVKNKQAKNLPIINVLQAKKPPKIDGILDEPIWQQQNGINLKINQGEKIGQSPKDKTTLKLAWDKNALYVAFICKDKDIRAKYTNPKIRNQKLWGQRKNALELIEIMISPKTPQRYYEININPYGASQDFSVFLPERTNKKGPRRPISDKTWNPPLTWKTTFNGTINNPKDSDKEWIVEIAIAWENLGIKNITQGQSFKANFYRGNGSNPEPFVAWSPTGARNFHIPARFGKIILSNKSKTK